jgi:1-acyl-sn-glycerol-3-phosphate acyltransferase
MVSRLAAWLMGLLGWRVRVVPPPGPKGIIIVYPHTSNWDFLWGYLTKLVMGLPLSFIGKDTLFRGPVAGLLRRMGGIPVNRRERTGLIGRLKAEFERRDWMWLAIAPEGTRSHVPHLKSGFYRLALAAGVPVGLAYIDYATRTVGMERYLVPSGDPEADMAVVRDAYAGKVGRHPELAGVLELEAEKGREGPDPGGA